MKIKLMEATTEPDDTPVTHFSISVRDLVAYVLPTGEDMELNGAVPDVVLWNPPGQWPQGQDDQLDKAIAVLQEDVRQWQDRPQPTLRKATER